MAQALGHCPQRFFFLACCCLGARPSRDRARSDDWAFLMCGLGANAAGGVTVLLSMELLIV